MHTSPGAEATAALRLGWCQYQATAPRARSLLKGTPRATHPARCLPSIICKPTDTPGRYYDTHSPEVGKVRVREEGCLLPRAQSDKLPRKLKPAHLCPTPHLSLQDGTRAASSWPFSQASGQYVLQEMQTPPPRGVRGSRKNSNPSSVSHWLWDLQYNATPF